MDQQRLVSDINNRLNRRLSDFDNIFATLTNPQIIRSEISQTKTLDVRPRQIKEPITNRIMKTTRKKYKEQDSILFHSKRASIRRHETLDKKIAQWNQSVRSSTLKKRTMSSDLKQTKEKFSFSPAKMQKRSQSTMERSFPMFGTIKKKKISKLDLSKINYLQIMKHISEYWGNFNNNSSPQQIFSYFRPLCTDLPKPSIKKYTNCIYFGQDYRNNTHNYQGFIYFPHKKKLFYGNFIQQRQNGKGVQINLLKNVVFIGQFKDGEKTGQFQVIRAGQRYQGLLKRGKYDGYGILDTQQTLYEGYFYQGFKHGKGRQYHKASSQVKQGQFYQGKFIQESSQQQQEDNDERFCNLGSTQMFQSLQKQQNLPKFTYPQYLKGKNRNEYKICKRKQESSLLESGAEDDPLPHRLRGWRGKVNMGQFNE